AQAVAAAVRKAVEGAVGARVTDAFNPVYTDFDSEGYVSFGNTLPVDAAPILMGFGGALDALKSGKRVTREGWNGQGMWAVLQKGYPDGIPINAGTAQATGLPEGTVCKFRPYLLLCTAPDDFVHWIPTGSDILADDWVIVPVSV
ncbi:MAG: hypothetical protein JWN15_2170, partial [Firmicutes bacterium]|nr:hypothetical protein [Bacillota bacterium]